MDLGTFSKSGAGGAFQLLSLYCTTSAAMLAVRCIVAMYVNLYDASAAANCRRTVCLPLVDCRVVIGCSCLAQLVGADSGRDCCTRNIALLWRDAGVLKANCGVFVVYVLWLNKSTWSKSYWV